MIDERPMLVVGGFAVLTLLGAALVSGSGLARWARLEQGAEHLFGSLLGGSAVSLLTIHALGISNTLRPLSLFFALLGVAAAVLAATRDGRTFREHLTGSVRELGRSLSAFRPLFGELRAAGVVPLAALALLLCALAWTTLLTYLVPSDSWDGVWYHDLMVGYAIQQHGYAAIELPTFGVRALFQQANGYPRNAEMLSLLFAIFTGRTFLELPSVIAAIPLALGTYLFALRADREHRVAAFVWAVALVLLPGARLQMRSTYVDGSFAAFNLAAFYFALDPKMDQRRAVFAAIALGLALGTKGLALLSVPPLALLGLAWLAFRGGRKHVLRSAGVGSLAVCIVLALGAPSYLLAWHRFQDPFWPLSVAIGPWRFHGLLSFDVVDVNSTVDVWKNLYSAPVPGHDYVDTRLSGYGIATGVVILPLAIVGILVLFWRFGRELARRVFGEEAQRTLLLLAAGAVAFFTLWKSPALWSARYNLHAVAIAMAFASVAIPRVGGRTTVMAAASATFVANVLMWLWSEPGWGVSWQDMLARLRATPAQREARAPLLVEATIEARDRELHAGDSVVWSGSVDFASLLFNQDFSNRLVYVVEERKAVDRAEAIGARWLAVPQTSVAARMAAQRTDAWQRVGLLHAHPQAPTLVFRRLHQGPEP